MKNTSSKILSFEEFLNRGAQDELPAELPTADGKPADDMPVLSDVELVNGPTAELPKAPEAGKESQEDAQ